MRRAATRLQDRLQLAGSFKGRDTGGTRRLKNSRGTQANEKRFYTGMVNPIDAERKRIGSANIRTARFSDTTTFHVFRAILYAALRSAIIVDETTLRVAPKP